MKKPIDLSFKVPSAMKRKRSQEQQKLFIDGCESNRATREFLLSEQWKRLNDEERHTLIHNVMFNAVCALGKK